MDDAHLALAAGATHGHVIVAETQRAGRGSHGRQWISATGQNLTFSIVLRGVPVDGLTLAAGLAIAHAVEAVVGGETRAWVKWPNDVWLGDTSSAAQKVAGVLVEARSSRAPEALVLGVGLNVLQRTFELPATSLAMHASGLEREAVLAMVLDRLEATLDRLSSAGAATIVRAVEGRLLWRGQQVRCGEEDRFVEGTLIGLAPNGALIIEGVSRHELLAGHLRRA